MNRFCLATIFMAIAIGLSVSSVGVLAQPGAPTIEILSPIRETLASVTINGKLVADNMQLLEVAGLGLLMSGRDYQRLRLANVKIPEVVRRDEDWVALNRLKGVKVLLNQRNLALELIAAPELFAQTSINVANLPTVKVSPIPLGAYLNYDIVADSLRGVESVRGLFEGVLFGTYGSLVTNHLSSRVYGDSSGLVLLGSPNANVRLETYFQKDFVDSVTRLKIGDAVVNPGTWGRANRFAGLQFGTDYSLNPRFITSPLLDFKGQVSLPSTVDLFINNGLVRRFEIAPGPFSIAQIPIVSGNGDARLVVRDALGKDVIINQPFFTVPSQLRKGITQYSFEVGALRQDFSVLSNSYNSPFVTGTVRGGLTDSLTIEGRAEHLLKSDAGFNHLSVLGLSAAFPIAQGHFVSPSLAYSDSDAGRGTQAAIQYGYSGTRLFYGLRAETSSANFRQLGFFAGELPQQHRYSLSVGGRVGNGSLALSITDSLPRPFTIQSAQVGQNTQIVSSGNKLQVGNLSYSVGLGRGWSMAAGLSRIVSGDSSTLAYLSLNYVPSASTYVSTNLNASRVESASDAVTSGSIRAGVRANESGGLGFEVEVGDTRQRLSGNAITRGAEVSVSVANERKVQAGQSSTSGRINARGAVVLTSDGVTTARPISNSFVIVSAPALPNSPVRTTGGAGVQLGSDGTAVLTRITAYDQTEVQVLPEKTPIDVTIDRLITRVTPAAKAGTIARLEVRKTNAVTFKAVDATAKVLAVGQQLEVFDVATGGRTERVIIGLDGLAYVKDLPLKSRVLARIGSQFCEIQLPAIPKEPIPDLGEVKCVLQPK
jgi:outer membrane usher protein